MICFNVKPRAIKTNAVKCKTKALWIIVRKLSSTFQWHCFLALENSGQIQNVNLHICEYDVSILQEKFLL